MNARKKTPLDVQSKLKLIKKILKQKQITLKMLAPRLEMSESGLKKLLNSSDIGLLRLYQLCEILNISITDIFQSEADDQYSEVRFSEEQQKFFLKNFIYFQFYWLIVYERNSVEETQKILKVNAELTQKILFKLDALQMIVLLPGNKVKVPHPTRIRWRQDGPLVEYLFRHWSHRLITNVLDRKSARTVFVLRYLQMTPETYQDLLNRLQLLEDEFVKIAIREMKMIKHGLVPCRWVMAADSESFYLPLESPEV